MKGKWTFIGSLLAVALLALAVGSGQAQGPQPPAPGVEPQGEAGILASLGTAFTYQGRLTDGGAPASGAYDFEFRLYDALSGGNPVGSPVTKDDVTVSAGLFTVQLDFGSVFDGTALYLEIGVRPGASTGPYTTLTPRQALTAAPYALHAARAPWSGLSGVPAGFADGTDDGASYQNVVIVAKSGGDFTSIQAALNSISDASAGNRYLVWVAPGTYNETVTMKPYVDIEGAGELTTKITYTGSASSSTGTVVGADNAELRFLTVENTGGNTYAIAIYNDHVSPRLTHVTASSAGGTHNYGVYNHYYLSAMTNVNATASGGTNSYGVYNSYSVLTMTDVSAMASGGTNNYGVYNHGSLPGMTSVTASASGGTNSYGVFNTGMYGPTINASVISARSATNNYGIYTTNAISGCSVQVNNSQVSASYGIYNADTSGLCSVLVNNSQVTGSTNTIRNGVSFTTRVGASQLSGGAVTGGGTVTCAGVYDENYTFYASTCP